MPLWWWGWPWWGWLCWWWLCWWCRTKQLCTKETNHPVASSGKSLKETQKIQLFQSIGASGRSSTLVKVTVDQTFLTFWKLLNFDNNCLFGYLQPKLSTPGPTPIIQITPPSRPHEWHHDWSHDWPNFWCFPLLVTRGLTTWYLYIWSQTTSRLDKRKLDFFYQGVSAPLREMAKSKSVSVVSCLVPSPASTEKWK